MKRGVGKVFDLTQATLGRQMTIRELRDLGVWDDINRKILHPMGLHLRLNEDERQVRFGGVFRVEITGQEPAEKP